MRFALVAVYATSAIYSYYQDSSQEAADDDETGNSFSLPQYCYPRDHTVDEAGYQMARRGPPRPTQKDIEEVKELLRLILHELRRPNPLEWITALKELILKFVLDPRASLLSYLSLSSFLIELCGDRFAIFDCPFSGLVELPAGPCSESSVTDIDSNDTSASGVLWGKNLWPAAAQTDAQGPWSGEYNTSTMFINEAASDWGLKCLCHEITDISPIGVKKTMEMQAEAKRRTGAQILESEGAMLDQANCANGEAEAILARMEMQAEAQRRNRAQILESEGAMLDQANRVKGAMLDQANRVKGEAEAILARMVSGSMSAEGSTEAANLRVAEQYIKTFTALAKNMTTMILPSDAGNPSAVIAQSLFSSVFSFSK